VRSTVFAAREDGQVQFAEAATLTMPLPAAFRRARRTPNRHQDRLHVYVLAAINAFFATILRSVRTSMRWSPLLGGCS
jgi:hypothetical protein